MKKLIPVIVALVVAYLVAGQDNFQDTANSSAVQTVQETAQVDSSTTTLVSGRQAQGSGTVTRVLPDDNDGSRHQRFILQLASGRTLLVAHISTANSNQTLRVVSFTGRIMIRMDSMSAAG